MHFVRGVAVVVDAVVVVVEVVVAAAAVVVVEVVVKVEIFPVRNFSSFLQSQLLYFSFRIH